MIRDLNQFPEKFLQLPAKMLTDIKIPELGNPLYILVVHLSWVVPVWESLQSNSFLVNTLGRYFTYHLKNKANQQTRISSKTTWIQTGFFQARCLWLPL